MTDYKIVRLDFRDEYSEASPEVVNLAGYSYLSILTDGAINPTANFNQAYAKDLELFYFKLFDNPKKFLINYQIYNLNIQKFRDKAVGHSGRSHSFLKLFNKAHADRNYPESGYGFFYVVLSQDPITFVYPKVVPNYHNVYTLNNDNELIWFGENNPSPIDSFGLAWLPHCTKVHILAFTNSTTCTIDGNAYLDSDFVANLWGAGLPVDITGANGFKATYEMYGADRLRVIINQGQALDKQIAIKFTFEPGPNPNTKI